MIVTSTRPPRPPHPRAAFTLVEVLAALVLIAIVLPAAMRGITIATEIAGTTRHRTEAAGLAQAKLAELLATGEWESGQLSGTFAPENPAYSWTAQSQTWDEDNTNAGLDRLDLTVTWQVRNREQSLTLTTLARASQ